MDLDQIPWFAAFKLRRELYSVTARGLGQKGARPEPQQIVPFHCFAFQAE